MIIIGHRGAKGLAPENTLAAIKKALELKVDAIEFDLRVTADGIVVLSHEAYLQDGHAELRIADTAYAELKEAKPDLATFQEALNIINKKAKLYVEVKPAEKIEPIVKTVKEYLAKGWPVADFALASFSQSTLKALHQALPKNPTIVIEKWSGVHARWRAKQLGTKTISMGQRWLWFGFIKAMSRSGYTLYSYTINSPEKARTWGKYGLGGVVTDYPDRFKN